MRRDSRNRPDLRVRHFLPVLVILFGFFSYRLYSLQVLQQDRFESLSRQNYIRTIRVPGLRGRIFDRNETLLVDNVARYQLVLNSRYLSRRQVAADFEALGEILDASPAEIRERWRKSPRDRNGARTVAANIDYPTVVTIAERAMRLPGVEVVERPRRWTVHGEVGAHVLGYTGEISSAGLEKLRAEGYEMGDEVGKSGVERTFESSLHGRSGFRKVRVYANGLIVDDLPGEGTPADPGKDLVLSIDWALQAAAQEILGSTPGAIVAMDPRNGDVLALVSSPTYDPNAFSTRSPERLEILTKNAGRLSRLVNVGLEAYPPGSIYKIPLALGALDAGRIHSWTEYDCPGVFHLGSWDWRCWKRTGHGSIGIIEAIQHSCDCYFYHLGKTVGVDFMDEATELFGFGSPTGIDLPGEKAGFRPARESKRRAVERFRTGVDPTWYPGDTINASIGQGVVLSTPLQVAAMTAMVANGGTLWRPRLVLEVRTRSGETVEERPPESIRRENFDRQALRSVIEGMDRVVNEAGGTAYSQRMPNLVVCGKTGTAQNEDREHDHAWFTCFAPRENPRIAVTVVCLWSGHGGSVAAPKAREILEAYFAGDRDRPSSRRVPLP